MTLSGNRVEALLLDFGGTIDTNGCHWGKMLWHAYQEVGVGITEQQFREAYVYGERILEKAPMIHPEHTLEKTIDIKLRLELEQLCKTGVWDVSEETFKLVHQALVANIYNNVSRVIERNSKVLRALKQRTKMVLITNFYGNMNRVLREFKLDDCFEQVIESAVVGVRKPDIRIFKMALEVLNINASNVLMVGDSFYKDIEPACKLGCQTAWLRGEGWTDKQYDESVPTHIITDFSQLTSLL